MDKITVLFVDDDVELLSSMKRLLLYEPYDIMLASSGEQALEILHKTTVDVLVTDVKMHGISGIELVEKVSQEFPEMVKVFLSGQPNFDAQEISSMVQTMHRGEALKFINKSTSLCEDIKQTLKEVWDLKHEIKEISVSSSPKENC